MCSSYTLIYHDEFEKLERNKTKCIYNKFVNKLCSSAVCSRPYQVIGGSLCHSVSLSAITSASVWSVLVRFFVALVFVKKSTSCVCFGHALDGFTVGRFGIADAFITSPLSLLRRSLKMR